jgi:hypothetical protein
MTIDMLTTAEDAALLNRAPVTIRNHANWHNIGTVKGNTRLFTSADVEQLRAIAHGKPGKPKRVKP